MELNQLSYFVEICKNMNMSRAAENLGMSQPALSRSIAKLEKELGFPLFLRDGPKLHMTRQGTVFYERMVQALRMVESARELGTMAAAYESQNLFIAASSVRVPAELMVGFGQQNPDVAIHHNFSVQETLSDMFSDGRAELLLSPQCDAVPGMQWIHLSRTPVVVLCRRGHKLAEQGKISPDMLLGVPLACYDFELTMIDLRQMSKGAPWRPVLQTSDYRTLCGYVAATDAVALIPEQEIRHPELCTLEMEAEGFYQDLYLGRPTGDLDLSDPARRFITFAQNWAKGDSQ